MSRARGSFSVVSQLIGKGLLVFRDPHGIRPLVSGQRQTVNGTDYIFASEDTMFAALGFEDMGDVAPGEVVFINRSGQLFRRTLSQQSFSPCIFEHVYFARPDATLNGVSVYAARLRMGEKLAQQWQHVFPDLLPDVIVPAPFTSNTAALAFAQQLGVRYAEGLYKNPFIGRTFIMPDGAERRRNVRYKLTPQKAELVGKRVLILDDSIVRGTTSREIVRLVREAGASEVYFVSACPPVKHPCFYGVDMPSHAELIAANKTVEEIKQFLGVDQVLYQTIEDLVTSVQDSAAHPCMACLNGDYIVGVPNVC
jgi:amidophosphoribosyltransferase